MSKTQPRPRRAYSYIRFSHTAQADGGSLARQARLTADYCERNGLTLDTSLTLNDMGVSAFRGDNVREGALAGFLEACRTGRVPKGSVLIVESLDRLSRDQIRPALQLFLSLQDYGITIVTHEPPREYDPASTDALSLIEPLIVFARAHEESVMKSHRRRDGWRQAKERARQGGGPLMKTCPAWLEVTPEGFRIKEQGATAVRLIFALARDGLGVHRITERLTREKVPPIGNGGRWVKAYVWRILTTPAAMGTYQPMRQEGRKSVPDGEPILGHYPAVVTEEEWQGVQAVIRARGEGQGGGRRGAEETNLFTGIARCAKTGERMHIVHARGRKGEGERKRYVYLVPTMETGAPGGWRIDYALFEAAILSCLRELRPIDIAGEGAAAAGKDTEIARQTGRLIDIDDRLERTKRRARTAEDFDAYLDLIESLHAERKQVCEQLAGLREERAGGGTAAGLGEAQSLIALLAKTAAGDREEVRRRVKLRLRQLVTGVWVLIVRRGRRRLAAVQIFFASGRRRDYLIQTQPGGQWWCRSLADVVRSGDLDMRDPADAAELERVLSMAGVD